MGVTADEYVSSAPSTRNAKTSWSSNKIRLVAGIVLVVVGVGFVLWRILDGGVGNAVELRDEFAEKVAPINSTSVFVAPANNEWWTLIEGFGGVSLGIGEISLPGNATWVGYSEGKAADSFDTKSTQMKAAYVAFDDRLAAESYVSRLQRGTEQVNVKVLSNVVVIVPASVDRDNEFAKSVPVVKGNPDRGAWLINLTQQEKQLAADSPFTNDYLSFVKNLGISTNDNKPTIWDATSVKPDIWWEGNMSGFKKNSLAPEKAVEGLSKTSEIYCDNSKKFDGKIASNECYILSNGLASLLDVSQIEHGSIVHGSTENGRVGKKKDLLSGFIQPVAWRGYVLGGSTSQKPAVKRIDFRIVKSNEMMLRPVFDTKN